jgi:outer membrane protein assembly factor BamB
VKSSFLPVFVAVLATVIASTSPAFAGSPWIQYGFDATHSSLNETETILTRHNVSDLGFRWVAHVGMSVATAPIVGGGMMFVASDGKIFAFDARTGMKLWSHLSCSGTDTVQAALGKHGLLVGDGGGDLAAYDPATGVQLWCDDEGGSIISAPAVHEDTVYITNGGDVVAADQGTGMQRWRFTPADFSAVTSTPAIANGVVYVTGGNSVFALNEKTGQKIWRKNLGPQANISAPSVSDSTVYVGGTGLYALSACDGHILWKKFTVGVNVSMPAIANNKVYVNSEDPNFGLHAFNATTGALVWQSYPDETEVTVAVANGVVYDVADTGELVMLNSDTGVILGTLVDPDGHPFNSSFGAQVAIVNGKVFVSTGDFFGANGVDSFRLP